MKLKQLECELSKVSQFESPKIELEQYPTTAHLAALMIYTADSIYDDISDRSIVDLGIGCGVLTCASSLMGASKNIGIDIDGDALDQARRNCGQFEIDVDLIHTDVRQLLENCPNLKADVVIMNPPFGTRNNGIDLVFLQVASRLASRAVYSLHKTSTRPKILKYAQELGMNAEVVAELRYDIAASYKFHKRKSVDIEVDFIRFAFV